MSDNVTVYNTRNAAGVTTTWLETEVCCSCSVLFAMPKEMRLRRLNDGGRFWCPNGHMQFYTKTRVRQLEEELAAQKTETERQRLWKEREIKARMAAETNAERLTRRVSNGVCPCCNRSFRNLKRHMKTKHPAGA